MFLILFIVLIDFETVHILLILKYLALLILGLFAFDWLFYFVNFETVHI